MTFEEFVGARGPVLRAALVAAYGPDVGLDAASDALAYGWEHWHHLKAMDNPSGYLYRVGQSAARRLRRVAPLFPEPPSIELPDFDPGLLPALAALTDAQRVAVTLVHGLGWPIVDVAGLLDVSHSPVRTHLFRALDRLRAELEVDRAE